VSKVELPGETERWKGNRFTFPRLDETLKDNEAYSVDFILEAPNTMSTEIRYFDCSLRIGNTNSRHLRLPLIVLPK
jgi:hypothetical protein